jgi:hypothetical protein
VTIEPEPDTNNWTWVLDRACAECGYDARSTPAATVAGRLGEEVDFWREALAGPDDLVRRRPAAQVWSVLEYGCHVRDIFLVTTSRVELICTEDVAEFPNWDQDATAVADHYAAQQPERVSAQLTDAAHVLADRLDALTPAEWGRSGRRSDGSGFTTDSLARYFLHDLVHHHWDIAERDATYRDIIERPEVEGL